MVMQGNKKIIVDKINKVCKSLFWKNKIAAGLIYGSLFLNGLFWLGIYFLVKNSQGIFVGHYNVFFGIDGFVDVSNGENWGNIFSVPMGGLFFLLLSIVMSIFLIMQFDKEVKEVDERSDSLITNRAISFMGSRLLLIAAWSLQLILLVYLIAIWKIN